MVGGQRRSGWAAAEPEQGLVGVAVTLVLFDGVGGRLFGEAVFELEGGDRQRVNEEAEVEARAGRCRGCSRAAGSR